MSDRVTRVLFTVCLFGAATILHGCVESSASSGRFVPGGGSGGSTAGDGGTAGGGGAVDGGEGGSGGNSGSGGSGATAGSESGSGGGSGISCSTDGDCGSGHYCSVIDECVEEGQCGGDGDCDAGQHCGAGSHTCLAEGECADSGDCLDWEACRLANETDNIWECRPGDECGNSEFQMTRLAPNMMILLDRSGSMAQSAGTTSRWNAAKASIKTVTTTYDAEIRFGLAVYSACLPGGCSPGVVEVPIAENNAAAIDAFLGPQTPAFLCNSGMSETSTGLSLHAMAMDPSLQDPKRENAVLLVTDGAESGACKIGGQDALSGAVALINLPVPVRTFVVGLGVGEAALAGVAAAGGTGQLAPASNEAELIAAFEIIAQQVVSCEYELGEKPENANELYVFFNDNPDEIPEDAVNGWTYEEATNKIIFHGQACEDLKTGVVTDVDVVFGCPMPVVE